MQPLLVAPLLEGRPAEIDALAEAAGLDGVVDRHLLLVDGRVPGQVGLGVPLGLLGLLVELAESGTGALVIPREQGVGVVLDGVGNFVDVVVGDRQDRLEVVDVGAADQLFVGCHWDDSFLRDCSRDEPG